MKYISWGYYAIEAINIQLWTNVKNITCESPNSINFCYLNGTDLLNNRIKANPV